MMQYICAAFIAICASVGAFKIGDWIANLFWGYPDEW